MANLPVCSSAFLPLPLGVDAAGLLYCVSSCLWLASDYESSKFKLNSRWGSSYLLEFSKFTSSLSDSKTLSHTLSFPNMPEVT